ncbi:hypothetical protein [Nocardiopsis trehalosi]|uniref:hypothetical protein n=1 Tax=Nocardiopsis trehalosi TaxID=109329 RepID=UPI0008353CD8|nr:hypothetical protein [Nocardiopsis trehalosi]
MNTRPEDDSDPTTTGTAREAAVTPDPAAAPAAPPAGGASAAGPADGAAPAGGAVPAGGTDGDGAERDADASDPADWELAAPRPAGVFSAETFSLAALLMVGAALVGTRLGEMWASVRSADQLSALSAIIMGDGGTAVLGVVLGLLALVLADADSRPWARWAGMAAVVVGLVFVVLSVTTYLMVPPPQPQPMMPAG